MPYSKPSDAPAYVPKKHRAQWVHVFNTEWEKHKDKPTAERERIAFSAANSVAGPNASKNYEALIRKAIDEEALVFADTILEAIEEFWKDLPAEVRPSLENSMLSGIGKGMAEIDVSTAAMISPANQAAQEYARDRAAELIGMKYDADGTLIVNPNAEWVISETTRNRIRDIVTEAFYGEISLEDVKNEIQVALAEEANEDGIFSAERAELIAQTEISRAQSGGNYYVWMESGVVKKLKWLTSEDTSVCEICDANDGQVVEIGFPFKSGDLYPGAHPRCRCVVVVAETI